MRNGYYKINIFKNMFIDINFNLDKNKSNTKNKKIFIIDNEVLFIKKDG